MRQTILTTSNYTKDDIFMVGNPLLWPYFWKINNWFEQVLLPMKPSESNWQKMPGISEVRNITEFS